MSNEYKLTYFPVKGLGEPIRFLLSYGNMKFEDIRIPKKVWPEIKSQLPFGQVPILEVDGKLAHQSVAIARYLAKQTGLTGSSDWENLEIDAMVDTITDLRSRVAAYNIEKNYSIKANLRELLVTNCLPYYLSRFDSAAKTNNGHLALGKLTWADLYFVSLLDYFNGVLKMDIIDDYEHLNAVKDVVLNLPGIDDWISRRPESDY